MASGKDRVKNECTSIRPAFVVAVQCSSYAVIYSRDIGRVREGQKDQPVVEDLGPGACVRHL